MQNASGMSSRYGIKDYLKESLILGLKKTQQRTLLL